MHGDFHGRIGIVTLVASHIHRLCLEEFQRAVAAVAPSGGNDGGVVVVKALVLLNDHYRSVQNITFHTAGNVLALYADSVCSMRQSCWIYQNAVRICVGYGHCLQRPPVAVLVYLYGCENTLVAGIVRELIHWDVLRHASYLKAGVLGVVQGLNADAGNVNGNKADVLCSCVATVVCNNSLQWYLTCTGSKRTKVKL